MGAPQLKKKKELNYRRGQTWRNCGVCDHFVSASQAMELLGRRWSDDHYPACRIMGLKPSRVYRITQNNQCDAYDNTKGLKRLKGEQ